MVVNNIKKKGGKSSIRNLTSSNIFKNRDLNNFKNFDSSNDDIYKPRIISYTEYKRKLFFSELNNYYDTDNIFSNNYDEINYIYFGDFYKTIKNDVKKNKKNNDKLDDILDNIEIVEKKNKNKKGGNLLTDDAISFLKLLHIYDSKHDFIDTILNDTNIIYFLNNEFKKINTTGASKEYYNKLFNDNSNLYETNILINTIDKIGESIFFNNTTYENFMFIEIDTNYDKYVSLTYNDIPYNLKDANINTLIAYIKEFFNYDNIDNTKYIYDTEIKLSKDLTTQIGKIHHELYNRIGTQIFPFENAYDPHSSNTIEIKADDLSNYKEILTKNFNSTIINNEYEFAVRFNTSNYLNFDFIKKQDSAILYNPVIIFKDSINKKKFIKYVNKILPPEYIIKDDEINIDKKNISKNINILLNDYNFGIEYKYSFNEIDVIKNIIQQLLIILKKPDLSGLTIKNGFLKQPMISNEPKYYVAYIITIYLIIAINPDLNNFTNDNLKELINILFDLKKSGDWGQSLFCSEYNKKYPTQNCFFISGDRLSAVRSLMCNNVNTIFGTNYTVIKKNRLNDDTKTIMSLYKNTSISTFKDFNNFILNNVLSFTPFKKLFCYENLNFKYFSNVDIVNDNENIINLNDIRFDLTKFDIFVKVLILQMKIILYVYSVVDTSNNITREFNITRYLTREFLAEENINNHMYTTYNTFFNNDPNNDKFNFINYSKILNYINTIPTANQITTFNNIIEPIENFLDSYYNIKIFNDDFNNHIEKFKPTIGDGNKCVNTAIIYINKIINFFDMYMIILCDKRIFSNNLDFIQNIKLQQDITPITIIKNYTIEYGDNIMKFIKKFQELYKVKDVNNDVFNNDKIDLLLKNINKYNESLEKINKIKDIIDILENDYTINADIIVFYGVMPTIKNKRRADIDAIITDIISYIDIWKEFINSSNIYEKNIFNAIKSVFKDIDIKDKNVLDFLKTKINTPTSLTKSKKSKKPNDIPIKKIFNYIYLNDEIFKDFNYDFKATLQIKEDIKQIPDILFRYYVEIILPIKYINDDKIQFKPPINSYDLAKSYLNDLATNEYLKTNNNNTQLTFDALKLFINTKLIDYNKSIYNLEIQIYKLKCRSILNNIQYYKENISETDINDPKKNIIEHYFTTNNTNLNTFIVRKDILLEQQFNHIKEKFNTITEQFNGYTQEYFEQIDVYLQQKIDEYLSSKDNIVFSDENISKIYNFLKSDIKLNIDTEPNIYTHKSIINIIGTSFLTSKYIQIANNANPEIIIKNITFITYMLKNFIYILNNTDNVFNKLTKYYNNFNTSLLKKSISNYYNPPDIGINNQIIKIISVFFGNVLVNKNDYILDKKGSVYSYLYKENNTSLQLEQLLNKLDIIVKYTDITGIITKRKLEDTAPPSKRRR